MKEVTLQVPDGKSVEWKEVNGVTIPVLVDEPSVEAKKDDRPVIERIKTFENAMEELGEDNTFVKEYWAVVNVEIELSADIMAFLKLRIIAAALNEGWIHQFTDEEVRWYPWFTLWTKEELADKSEEWKKDRALWLFGGKSGNGASCGLACASSSSAWSNSGAYLSARLAVKNEELAVYFGKQFISIWADYVVIPRNE